jgi:hypothetical protein
MYKYFLFLNIYGKKGAQMNIFPYKTLYDVYFIGQFNERVLQECQH